MHPKRILAVDIGGSKLLTALASVAAGGHVSFSGRVRRELDRRFGKAEILDAAFRACDETLRAADGGFDAVGITIPGLADPETGTWLYAPFSGSAISRSPKSSGAAMPNRSPPKTT